MSPTDPEGQGDLLALIAEDLSRTDGQRVQTAILADAHDHGGHIDPNRVRASLTNESGHLDVWPKTVGAGYGALLRAGVIRRDGWTVSTDTSGGNAGKPARLYRLTVEGVDVAGPDR